MSTLARGAVGGLIALGFAIATLAFAASIRDSDRFAIVPTAAQNVGPYVHVAGERSPGGILFVAVRERRASLLEKWLGGYDDGTSFVPVKDVVPQGSTERSQRAADQEDMDVSQRVAAAVAERALGKKVTPRGARVVAIASSSPAQAAGLRAGDVIVRADGADVTRVTALAAAMGRVAPGAAVSVDVLRGGVRRTLRVGTRGAPDDRRRAVMGIRVEDEVSLPVKVSYSIGALVGPSAGLAFALEIYASLGGVPSLAGHRVAVTGAIDLDGHVLPIGAAREKAYGAALAHADILIVPLQNLADARSAKRRGLRIVPVATFDEARRQLAALAGT